MDLSKHAPLRINDIRSKYKVIDKVGKGTYGTVFKVMNLQDNKYYAIKKFQNTEAKLQVQGFPITALREISLLKQIDHPNIINLKEIICSRPNKRNLFRGSTFLVFDYMHHDFSGLFRNKIKFTLPQIKCIMKQILLGCSFLHQNKIMHRDIKSANILLNDQGLVQLADFGLGRRTRFDNIYTYKVVTLWYRAPELLLGCKTYNHKVDVWSIGCVMAELLTTQVLFKKQTEYAIIERIYELCGDLQQNQYTEDYLRGCAYYHDMRPKKAFKNILQSHIKKLYPSIDDLTLKFIKGLLQLNPYKRLSCQQALEHQFFKQAPLPCAVGEIKKLDVEYHQMFRDRSLKIQRKKQQRKQSADWSEQEEKIKKQKLEQKTEENSRPQVSDRYERNTQNKIYERRQYDRYEERKYEYPARRQYPSRKKYDDPKPRRKYSRSKSYSSSSSSSSRSRSRNKKKHDSRNSEQKKRLYKSSSNNGKMQRQREYSSRKQRETYRQKSYQKQKERSMAYYDKQRSSSNKPYESRKQYQEEARFHKDRQSNYRERESKQLSSKQQYSERYQKKQSAYRPSQKYPKQPYDNKPYNKIQSKQRHPDQVKNSSYRNEKHENGEYRGKKDIYQKYDYKTYPARESRHDYPARKQYGNSSQKYNQERRPYVKQREKQSRDSDRRDYRSKDFNTKKNYIQNRSSPQRKRNSSLKKSMDVQQY